MANYLYVDNSNVWIEGMHVAAFQRGLVPNLPAAIEQPICDYSWKPDFGRLFEFAGGKASEVGRAVLYGSRPPANDSLWDAAKRKGFEVVVYDRNLSNKEKKIDTKISVDIVSDSYKTMKSDKDEVTLVAGDADYVPMVENLKERGFKLYVVFWGHASRELRESATKFTPLDQYLEHLNLNKK